jgi:hypothetical protein
MTSLPVEKTRFVLRFFPWFMFLIGLVAGFFVGQKTSQATALGTCFSSDTTQVVAEKVSLSSCQAQCKTCVWELR